MYAAAAVFLGYFVLLAWCGLRGVVEPGITADVSSGALEVRSVANGWPADRAGIMPGDKLFAKDGRAIRSRFDWMAITANWEPGKTEQVVIERGGARTTVTLDVRRRAWPDSGIGAILLAAILWGARLCTLTVAAVVAFRRPDLAISRLGAWFLAAASVSSVVMLPGQAEVWRGLPSIAGLLLWIPALSTVLQPAIFFSFLASFPRHLFPKRWMWGLVWLPAGLQLEGVAGFLQAAIYAPERAAGAVAPWFLPAFVVTSTSYIAGGIGLQVVNWRRLPNINDRRRAGILAIAAVAGWTAALPIIAFDWRSGTSSLAPAFFSSAAAISAVAVFLLCVAVLSLALLRKRVFGFELIIRQGLRYALARASLLALTPLAAGLLAADLLAHGRQPLLDVLKSRGWIYVGLGALALIIHSRRMVWLERLDRRFFREHYDAERILLEVAETARVAGDFRDIAPRVVAQIEAALHAVFAAVMLRQAGDNTYRCAAASPAGEAPPPFPCEGKLISLARVLGKPLELGLSSGWLREQLPPEDTAFVKNTRMELMVPISGGSDGADALLVLGPKRSEEPYTAEDKKLLAAIAASLALAIERAPARGSAFDGTSSLRECPSCGACYDSGMECCSGDGVPLARRSVPRVLAGRYRLDKRLGQGGMGAVYEALDTALDRKVAAKIVHDELVESPAAAERFRREAQAVAAFSHPSIVTVHDFGVVAGTRAFLVMELLTGRNLREELRDAGRLAARRVLSILTAVCGAVHCAHQRGLIHRDLKPENIFLVREEAGEVTKVLDFGVAKWLRPAIATAAPTKTIVETSPGILVGTIPYMSPEQLLGGTPDPAWDLWAITVMAYESLTGRHPFPWITAGECRQAVFDGAVVKPTEILPSATERWNRFFETALSAESTRRPQTARELIDTMAEALG
jgi:tRNA A-37 threonylcarbamoyl transferase component Bud32